MDTANINDFRVSIVDGEQMLSFFDRDRQAGIILDQHYRVQHVLDLRSENVNSHEFNVINDGRSALVLKNDLRSMTQREKDIVSSLSRNEAGCLVQYTRFQEIDIESGEVTFEFDSRGKIGVDETREWIQDGSVSAHCKEEEGWWDFL